MFVPHAVPAEGAVTHGTSELLAALVDALHMKPKHILAFEILLADAASKRLETLMNRADVGHQDAPPAEHLAAVVALEVLPVLVYRADMNDQSTSLPESLIASDTLVLLLLAVKLPDVTHQAGFGSETFWTKFASERF